MRNNIKNNFACSLSVAGAAVRARALSLTLLFRYFCICNNKFGVVKK